MPSSRQYLDFILDQLSAVDDVDYRRMMGEYLLYHRGKLVGGIYDDRLLVKPTPVARELLPSAPLELPYPGAAPMLLVEDVDNAPFLSTLLPALSSSLPPPKPSSRTSRKPRKSRTSTPESSHAP